MKRISAEHPIINPIMRLIVVLIILSFPPQVSAGEPESVEQLLDRAASLVEQRLYPAAIQVYLQAKTIQPDNPDIVFNLGVSYYQAKQYADAKTMFLQASHSQTHASLSYLNLGLIALRENKTKQAHIWLNKVLSGSGTEENKQLARTLMERIESEQQSVTNKSNLSFLLLTLTSGSESNSVFPTLENVPASSTNNVFFDAFVFGNYALQNSADRGANIYANAYMLKNRDTTSTDFYFTDLGIDKNISLNTIQQTASFDLTRVWLDKTPMEMAYKITYKLNNAKQTPLSPTLTLSGAYVQALATEFSSYTGYQYGAKIDIKTYSASMLWRMDLSYEGNNRRNASNSGYFRSSSPDYYKIRVRNSLPISNSFTLKSTADYRLAKFRGTNITTSKTAQRQDTLLKFTAKLEYSLNSKSTAGVQLDYQNNDSNFGSYRYIKKTATIGIDRIF